MQFFPFSCCFSLSGPNILLSALFAMTLYLCPSEKGSKEMKKEQKKRVLET
jgi:hypothetical protein